MKMSNSQLGSSVVETCLILSFLLPTVGAGLLVAAAASWRTLAHHILYESLICVSTGRSENFCSRMARQQLEQSIPSGKCDRLSISSTPVAWIGTLRWQLPGPLSFKVHHQLPRQLVRSQ
ncbi:MAG: hypothetical protein IT288_15610 [Bdellovibrionales bacterium]|nr:hypothetical protein [Bdellovibrionales bacterium]